MIVDPDFLDHWRTRMLTDILEDECAPLYVIRLWGHCQTRRAWKFDIPSPGIRALCHYSGDAETLDKALCDCGFLFRDGNSVEVVGWDHHNASLITSWKNGKKGGRPPKKKPGENPRVTDGLPKGNPVRTHGKPESNPSETDKIGLDGIGEDLILEEAGASSVGTQAVAWSPTGGWSGIGESDMEEWREAYPACDIERQLAAMEQWLKSNPAKAKKKQWRRFVTGWLSREQERGGDMRGGSSGGTRKSSINDYEKPEDWTEDQLKV